MSGLLLRETDSYGPLSNRFSEYQEFKGKQFPRLVTTFQAKKTSAVIEVQDLTQDFTSNSESFEVDAQYKTTEGCEHPTPPSPISVPDPIYPTELTSTTLQEVQVSAVINKNGKLEDIVISHSAGALDTYAMDTFRQWRFVPASCGDLAVPSPFIGSLDFLG
ncbi:MAG: energy transducer TonB, partial [Acidobacteria bacterium]|nr:energy transducer TonB [Acidobacteriota bacterium]